MWQLYLPVCSNFKSLCGVPRNSSRPALAALVLGNAGGHSGCLWSFQTPQLACCQRVGPHFEARHQAASTPPGCLSISTCSASLDSPRAGPHECRPWLSLFRLEVSRVSATPCYDGTYSSKPRKSRNLGLCQRSASDCPSTRGDTCKTCCLRVSGVPCTRQSEATTDARHFVFAPSSRRQTIGSPFC